MFLKIISGQFAQDSAPEAAALGERPLSVCITPPAPNLDWSDGYERNELIYRDPRFQQSDPCHADDLGVGAKIAELPNQRLSFLTS